MSTGNLANCYDALSRPADALKLREETLAIRRRVLPQDHPDTLTSMGSLANSYDALARPADALKLREEALGVQKRVLPPDHPETVRGMHNLAVSYALLDRHADALKLQQELLAIQRRVLPPDHPDTLLCMTNLAASLVRLDRGTEAILLLDAVLAQTRNSPAVNPRVMTRVFVLRAKHCLETGDPAGCRSTAEMWEKSNRTDANSLYNAACIRAFTADIQARTPGVDAARFARDDADRATRWLHEAVQAGYENAAHMSKDAGLDALRERADFQQLLASLAPTEPAPPPRPAVR